MKKMKTEISIGKEWFEKNKKDFITIESYDDNREYYKLTFNDENHERLISDDGTIKINTNTDHIMVTTSEIKPDLESLISLAQLISKYYNRAKTAFESLK